MILGGVDYSIRTPCICVFVGMQNETFTFDRCTFSFLTDTKKYANFFLKNIYGERFQDWDSDSQRFGCIADWAMDKLIGCEQIAIEGYSMGSKGRVFSIAEATGLLKHKIYSSGVPLEVVPPTSVKKFATGKGNADKEQMHQSFMKETGVDLKWKITPDKTEIGNPVSDIVDSYYICKFLYDKIINDMVNS